MNSEKVLPNLKPDSITFQHYFFLLTSLVLLSCTSLYSFLLFHTFAELIGVGVALGIFFITWNSRDSIDNQYYLFVGICHLFIATISLLHALSYRGMNVFIGHDSNLPTQLWIMTGYFQCITFLIAPFFFKKRVEPNFMLAIGFLLTTAVSIMIFKGWFPDCFIEGKGLTPFKKISEVLICLGLLISIIPVWKNCELMNRTLVNKLTAALIFNALSRVAFVFYVSVYGVSNLLGHCFYLIYIYFIYRMIIEESLIRPHNILFSRLNLQKEALEEAGRNLEAKVADRTKKLEEVNANLTISNRNLEDFAYIVSHDLREPLRGISNLAGILLDEKAEKLGDEGCYMLNTLVKLAKRQEDMIEAILQYSRVSRMVPETTEVDLNSLVQEIQENLQAAFQESQAQIRVMQILPKVNFDRTFITLIFSNLISNAIKFNDKEKKIIEIGVLNTKEKSPTFYIKDNGIGIPQKHQEKIFTIFKRLHHKDAYGGGTGVGLAIVKNIIDTCGGQIWLESREGFGSTFFFSLYPSKDQKTEG